MGSIRICCTDTKSSSGEVHKLVRRMLKVASGLTCLQSDAIQLHAEASGIGLIMVPLYYINPKHTSGVLIMPLIMVEPDFYHMLRGIHGKVLAKWKCQRAAN